jgi:hypothetical protein
MAQRLYVLKKRNQPMKKGILGFYLTLSFLILLPAHAMAKGGRIHIGNLKIIPGLTVQELYDDNVFKGKGTNNTDEIEETDWITHLKPSFSLDYTLEKRGNVKLGYEGDFAFYGEREESNWQTHKGVFNVDYEAPGGIILGISETFTDAEDPYGADNEFGLGEPQTKRWNNDLKSEVGYLFSKRFKILGYYDFYIQDFEDAEDFAQDYDTNEFGVGSELRLLPKTWSFIRYHYGAQDYISHPAGSGLTETNDAAFEWHRVNVGLIWDSGAKLNGELNFGYQWREHENQTDTDGQPYENKDTWIATTAIDYTATSTTTIGLTITRATKLSTAGSKEFFDDTSFGLSLTQKLLTKLTLTADAKYGKNEYNQPDLEPREDDNYAANIALKYKIQKWLSTSVSYAYEQKDSNVSANEYIDNQFAISLDVVY